MPVSNSVPFCQPQTVSTHVNQQVNRSQINTSQEVQAFPHANDPPAMILGNHTTIRDREVHSDSQQPPASTQCLKFVSRIFRTYPRMMLRSEQLPPFIHRTQISSAGITAPLENCFALSRMWESGKNGIAGRNIVQTSIRQEMKKLLSEVHTDHRSSGA